MAAQPILAYIEQHLFDPGGLKVKTVMRRCEIRDHKLQTFFHATFGQSLRTYIQDCRLVVAGKLLGGTTLNHLMIAHLTGYADAQALGSAFRRWSGLGLAKFRKRAKATQARFGEAEVELHPIELRRKALAGELDGAKAEALFRRLREIYPEGPETAGVTVTEAVPVPFDRQIAARALAEMTWQAIRGQTPNVQKATVLASYPSPELFHLLLEKSREEGRLDRRRGVELAELALVSLDRSRPLLGEEVHDLEALGWAWVGNARRLCLDYGGAEAAFARAEVAWEVPRGRPNLHVRAQILDFRAALRMFQRRFDEALTLENNAIELLRGLRCPRHLVRALIVRGSIAGYTNDPRDMIADLCEAQQILVDHPEPYLKLSVHTNLAAIHAVIGDYSEAARWLPEAMRLCTGPETRLVWYQLQWVQGLVHRGQGDPASAECCFREARAGFIDLDEMDHAAVVALDQAILYSEQGRPADVARLVLESLPVFEALQNDREAVTALRLLKAALGTESLELSVLREARALLERLRLDPSRTAFR